jgi:hypothetical protein
MRIVSELEGAAWRERRKQPNPSRPSFGTLAREAVEKHVPEVRTPDAWWSIGNNALWVRWPVERGVYAYLGIHRHLGWVSGEAGVSREPQELSALFPLPGVPAAPVPGYRIRLGHLLEGQDRWWPAGNDLPTLVERLEWLALQLRVKGNAYFSHYPAPAGSPER